MELLKRLVQIPTVNSEHGEKVIEIVLNELRDLGCEHRIYEVDGIKSLVVRCKGEGPLLAFNGHYDVVPVSEGWTKDPFGAEIEGGKLYGRGASDMKGGLVASIEAFKELAKQGKNVMLMVVGDEEKGGKRGTKAVLEMLEEKPRYVLVTEGMQGDINFGDSIKVGRRGVAWFDIVIKGVPGHASNPQKARNPADGLLLLLSTLKTLKLNDAPEMIPTTIVPTYIEMDGGALNVIPEQARVGIDMRYNYNIEPVEVMKSLVEILEKAGYNARYEVKILEPAFFNRDKRFLEIVQGVMRRKGYIARPDTQGGSSDARFFAAMGIPVLEIGTRAFNIHSTDEYVILEDVEKLKELLVEIGNAL
ncbi:MAG: succinyl-diaminopimelate desuccinylase [Candidatus Micrarchaeota archaeon]|nr:succinyl-diaminopimelate desuccinylase [Candidatus Micrarchaeota archaeon]